MERPLDVVFFPMETIESPSSRVLCYQYEAPLAALGARVRMLAPSSSALHLALRGRSFHPDLSARIARAIYWYLLVLPRRLAQLLCLGRPDVVVVHNSLLRERSWPLLELILRLRTRLAGIPVLYNLDVYIPGMERSTRARIAMADVVCTGNSALAELVRSCGARLEILEGAVDTARYTPAEARNSGPVAIGWSGSDIANLEFLEATFEAVLEETDAVFRFFTSQRLRGRWPEGRVLHESWGLEREVEQLAGLDIGINPLADSPENRAKEGYKIKVYMAMGLPVVASDVGHNRNLVQHGRTGFLARTAREWKDALIRLVRDPELRHRMGAAGRVWVVARHGLQARAVGLKALLSRMANAGHDGGRDLGGGPARKPRPDPVS